MADTELLEPAKLYKLRLKDEHHSRVEKRFDELTKLSGVDIAKNKETVSKYYKSKSDADKIKGKMEGSRALKGFMIALIVISLVLLFIGILCLISNNQNYFIFGIIATILGPIHFLFAILMIVLVVSPRTKKFGAILDKLLKEENAYLQEAWSQMAPLNSIFDASDAVKMFKETAPLINLDRTYTNERFECMKKKYGFKGVGDENHSYLGIQSGTILGNPFIFAKQMTRSIVSHRYEGTLVITWTTYVRTKNGSYPVTHTETLHAHVDKPMPTFSEGTHLLYCNEAAPRLIFSRHPSGHDLRNMSPEQIAKYVRKHEDDLEDLSKKQMKKGGNYTPLGNPEFELFFGGLDRNNEVEYRLLFTPLAQKSMLDLLKSDEGYGDDFSMYKNEMLNMVISSHMQTLNLFVDDLYFAGFDYEDIKDRFISYHDEFFRGVFFDLAPLLSIPLYQQHKAHEYIYQNTIKSNVPDVIHEVIANTFDQSLFLHKDSDTQGILKTRFIKKDDISDAVEVTAESYEKIPHTDYVTVMGGDGHPHAVPVHWFEYKPLTEVSEISILDLGLSKEEIRAIRKESDYQSFVSSKLVDNGIIFNRGVCSTMMNEHQVNFDVKSFKKIMHK